MEPCRFGGVIHHRVGLRDALRRRVRGGLKKLGDICFQTFQPTSINISKILLFFEPHAARGGRVEGHVRD
jgi:hypothetical protein